MDQLSSYTEWCWTSCLPTQSGDGPAVFLHRVVLDQLSSFTACSGPAVFPQSGVGPAVFLHSGGGPAVCLLRRVVDQLSPDTVGSGQLSLLQSSYTSELWHVLLHWNTADQLVCGLP